MQGTQSHCSLTVKTGGKGREVGRRSKTEGTHVYLWLIHVDVGRNQHNIVIILQLKMKQIFLKSLEKKTVYFPASAPSFPILLSCPPMSLEYSLPSEFFESHTGFYTYYQSCLTSLLRPVKFLRWIIIFTSFPISDVVFLKCNFILLYLYLFFFDPFHWALAGWEGHLQTLLPLGPNGRDTETTLLDPLACDAETTASWWLNEFKCIGHQYNKLLSVHLSSMPIILIFLPWCWWVLEATRYWGKSVLFQIQIIISVLSSGGVTLWKLLNFSGPSFPDL